MHSTPPWLHALRDSELVASVRRLADALNAVGEAAGLALGDMARELDAYQRCYGGRRLRRALRALGLAAPRPAPVLSRTAHGRRRSRRELRDIRRRKP